MSAGWPVVATLLDPTRRAVYEQVRAARCPVTREQTADALRISRNLAAFHLDKLAAAGLLDVAYPPPADRPRTRGRSPKVYRPATVQVALTIPERRYDLMGEILATAVAEQPDDVPAGARRVARERGQELARAACNGRRPGDDVSAVAMFNDLGFEPEARPDDTTVLHNCPFHRVAQCQPAVVCDINQAFVSGLLDGADAPDHIAVLAPQPGACCVVVQRRPGTIGRS